MPCRVSSWLVIREIATYLPQSHRRLIPTTHWLWALWDADRVLARDNLSFAGVFVFDLDPLPVGSEIIFTLRAGDQDISLEGIVRHSVDQEGMGIQFTKVSPE